LYEVSEVENGTKIHMI